ncbi:MAG: hypothetical protein ACK5LK_11465 [Chthoniobacterales bacterium]
MNIWIKSGIVLVLIWSLAASVAYFAKNAQASPEKLVTYLKANPLDQTNDNTRQKTIEQMIRQVNRLDFEDRQTLRRSPELRKFFSDLKPEERDYFIEQTMPEGFRQMMLAFNQMEPAKRKRFVDRAIADIEAAEAKSEGVLPNEIDRAEAQKIIDQGLQTFYTESSAEVKLDFAPVIERIQQSLQSMR